MIRAFLALLLFATPAFAQVAQTGAGAGSAGGGGGGGSVNYTFQAAPALQAGTVNPQSFTGVAIGTAATNRYVIVCVGENNNGPVTAVTVGGVSATKAADASNGTSQSIQLWYANVTTGTTATINLTSTTTFPTFVGISVATITTATPTPNTTSQEVFGFNADPQVTVGALTIPTNGVGVACGGSSAPNATPTINSGGTLDSSASSGTSWQVLLFHKSTAGSYTPSVTGYNFAGYGMAAASWGP